MLIKQKIEKEVKKILKLRQRSTWVLAAKIGNLTTPEMLKIMKSMEQRGHVRRSKESLKNNIVWQLVA